MRFVAGMAVSLGVGALACATPKHAAVEDATPQTLAEFKAAASRVLAETGVPGAGIALVTADGIEWAGGLGWADRDRRIPVTAETHFRVGSISNSFVALALVQLYEDAKLDLDAPVASVAPDIRLENPWDAESPVSVRHVLEHTAGFDDVHFNEVYVRDGAPTRQLAEILLSNPASRRVRWRPGTRMAHSSPGYAVAGRLIEVVSGLPFDTYVADRILSPLEMTTSTFALDPKENAALAQGYDSPAGPPVARRQVHLRPAAALQTSAGELSHFVQMLLGWGERLGTYVVDPEYQSNMEWPRTTAASAAGVRAGYGLGIASRLDLPYHVLGHDGGIDGFACTYGYSPARDVGYVVLLNATFAPAALTRLSSLALRYLKRGVDPAPDVPLSVAVESLARFEGYYLDANPRRALAWALEFPTSGHSVRVRDQGLVLASLFGEPVRLVPVNEGVFRREHEVAASMAFTSVDGEMVLAGADVFAVKRRRWPLDAFRAALVTSLAAAATAPFAGGLLIWRRGRRDAVARLAVAWCVSVSTCVVMVGSAAVASAEDLAVPSVRSLAVFGASTLYPLAALVLGGLTLRAWAAEAHRSVRAYAATVACAHLGLVTYMAWWGLVAFRSWAY